MALSRAGRTAQVPIATIGSAARVGCSALLASTHRACERTLRLARQIDSDKVLRRIQIVLARFVHYPYVAVVGCARIGKLLVELAELEVLAPLVPDAEQVPFFGRVAAISPRTA